MPTNKQIYDRLVLLEARVAKLEAAPGGTDYGPQIAALDARLDVLEALTCPEQARFEAIEAQLAANAAKDATEAAAQDVLEADHIPLP